MPTVLRSGPDRLFFYSGDREEPGTCTWSGTRIGRSSGLIPCGSPKVAGFGRAEIRRVEALVRDTLREGMALGIDGVPSGRDGGSWPRLAKIRDSAPGRGSG